MRLHSLMVKARDRLQDSFACLRTNRKQKYGGRSRGRYEIALRPGENGITFNNGRNVINLHENDVYATLGPLVWQSLTIDVIENRIKVAPGNAINHHKIITGEILYQHN